MGHRDGSNERENQREISNEREMSYRVSMRKGRIMNEQIKSDTGVKG